MVPLSMSEDIISQVFIPPDINPVRDIVIHLNQLNPKRVWLPLSRVELEPEGPRNSVRVPEVQYHDILHQEG